MLANMHYPKDHETLLDAWAKVIHRRGESRRHAFMVLAGRDVSRLSMLRAQAQSLNLAADSIQFLGDVEDVAGLLSASDLSVLSSRMEGCPNALLESMLAGVPVLGTDIPGIREAVGPENCGYLAPPGDSEALAGQMLAMMERLKDTVLKKKIIDRNRERVQKEFSVQNMCRQYAELIARGTRKSE
jgi:glycosyltransferase involved in cell wall biosynthesis